MAGGYQPRALDEQLLERIEELIREQNRPKVKEILETLRPADAADLIEHLDPEERLFIFRLLEPEEAGEVLVELETPAQGLLLKDLEPEALTEIVERLDSDDAADVVGDLPPEQAEQIIQSVPDVISKEIVKLLPYADDTAGGLMGLEYVSVPMDATLRDAVEIVRRRGKDISGLYHIWVTDSLGRLAGVISLKDLVLESPDRKVQEVMNPEVISVDVDMDQEEVLQYAKKYNLVSVPVVDKQHRLVGVISHDDIIDAMEEETDEDISLMAGVLDKEVGEQSLWKISRARMPWLIAGLAGEMISALVIRQFQTSLEKLVVLAFFFPVIMAMGGSSGSQAAIVVVRGLATGDITLLGMGKRLLVELRVALLNGLALAVLLGLIVTFWLSDRRLGIVLGASLFSVVICSGIVGSAAPFVFKRFGIDPALATGPFVTTCNDIMGLLIYLSLVTLVMTWSL